MIRQLRDAEPIPAGEPRRYVRADGHVRLRWLVGTEQYVEAYEARIVTGRQPGRVTHLDGDRSNNDPANLRVVLPRSMRPPVEREPRPVRAACSIDGCEQLSEGRSGLCKKHATRARRHGDPLRVVPPEERCLPSGARHPAWTGAAATYSAVHQRVRRQRGSASGHPCVDCGEAAAQWSFDGDRTTAIDDPKGPYSTDLADYVARCVRCHKNHDLELIRRAS